VDIYFKQLELARVLNSGEQLKDCYGVKTARQIRLRLAVLRAVACVADVPTVAPDRFRQLEGSSRLRFSVDAVPFCIIFEPIEPRLKSRGKVDLRKITSVTILEIVEK